MTWDAFWRENGSTISVFRSCSEAGVQLNLAGLMDLVLGAHCPTE